MTKLVDNSKDMGLNKDIQPKNKEVTEILIDHQWTKAWKIETDKVYRLMMRINILTNRYSLHRVLGLLKIETKVVLFCHRLQELLNLQVQITKFNLIIKTFSKEKQEIQVMQLQGVIQEVLAHNILDKLQIHLEVVLYHLKSQT